MGDVFGNTSHDAGKQIKEGTIQPALVRLKSMGNDEPISVEFMTGLLPTPRRVFPGWRRERWRVLNGLSLLAGNCLRRRGYEDRRPFLKRFCSISTEI